MEKRFIFHDENTDKNWCFNILTPIKLSEIELDILIDDLIDDSHDYDGEDFESTYGVHDVAFGENDLLGFTSYEIEEDKFPELMEKWRDIFKRRGLLTSEIFTL